MWGSGRCYRPRVNSWRLRDFEGLQAEEQAGERAAEQRSDPEQPELLEGLATDEDSGAEAAGRVHTGAGDVDAEQMNGNQGEADDQSGKAGRGGLLGGSKDHDQEEEGGDNLVEEGGGQVVSAAVASSPAVLAEATGCDVVPAVNAGSDDAYCTSTQDCSDALADPIANHVHDREATGDKCAEADGRIDVAAGDGANAVGRANEAEAEGKCNADDADQASGTAGNDGDADSKEHQDEGSNQLRKVFFHFLSHFHLLKFPVQFCAADGDRIQHAQPTRGPCPWGGGTIWPSGRGCAVSAKGSAEEVFQDWTQESRKT